MRLIIYKQTNEMIILIVATLGILNVAGFLLLVKLTGTRTEYDFYQEIKKETERRLYEVRKQK